MPVKLTLDQFKLKSNYIHNNKFNYEKVIYKNNKTSVIITCPVHGDFNQTPGDHLANKGCSACNKVGKSFCTESFIKKAIEVHGDIYDYSNTVYTINRVKVEINCNIHGIFSMRSNHHINGYGCPSCGKNISNKEIEFKKIFEDQNLEVISGFRPKWLGRRELDLYIPELNLAVELNGGIYHHSHIDSNFSYLKNGYKPSNYHKNKYNDCKLNGVNLIHVFDFECSKIWIKKLNLYLKNPKIYSIVFENTKRTFKYSSIDVMCFGKSNIIQVPLCK